MQASPKITKSFNYTHIVSKYILSILIYALGNSGKKYDLTRHNVGPLFIDYLISKEKLELLRFSDYSLSEFTCNNPYKAKKDPTHKLLLLKVDGFMNTSGFAFKQIYDKQLKEKCSNFKIICDDLETDLGVVKNSWEGGDRGHNGLKSLVSAFKNNNFEKIKIGIGRPNSKDPEVVSNYVLSKFSQSEIDILTEKAFPKIEKYLNLKC